MALFIHKLVTEESNMERIIRRMRQYYPVSDEAVERFKSCSRRAVFPAKAVLVEAGRINRNVYFIERGVTRSYSLFDGKEVTTWFSVEGDATCSSLSLYRVTAGFEYVETLEETETYVVTTGALAKLYKEYIDIANWGRVLQQENFLRLQDTHIARLNLTAQERYEKFLKDYPEICNRVNLAYIASFLGITQPSLSRIRRIKR